MSTSTKARLAVEIEEATAPGALEALGAEWSELWTRCPGATPFQSPEWLIPWWRHFGTGGPWVLDVRHAGRLVGLVPLYVWEEPETHARAVRLIGTGNTDYLDALFAPGFERPGMQAVFATLAAHRNRWDLCDFQQLPGHSPLLACDAPEDWHAETVAQDVCPVLALPARDEPPERSIPPRRLKRLRDDLRRVERLGALRFEEATDVNFAALFQALLALHRARWAQKGLPGVLDDDITRRFHEEAAWRLLRAGRLRFSALRIDGRIVAVFYGLADARTTYYYLGGFDPEFRRQGVGVLMVGHAIREAIRAGAEAFDFLRGAEAYKYEWGARDRTTSRRLLRFTPKGPGPIEDHACPTSPSWTMPPSRSR